MHLKNKMRSLIHKCVLYAVMALVSITVTGSQKSTYSPIQRWQWQSGHLTNADSDPLLLVGSIQKPFIVKAWAETHSGDLPIIACSATSGCWRTAGHGDMNLVDAMSNSCNEYFLKLAEQTSLDSLKQTFKNAGFQGRISCAESAIGLDVHGPKIRPSNLFKAYSQLITLPWQREDVRQLLIHGLRQAATSGTAKLSRPGYFAKTGTIQGRTSDTTIGLVIALDGSGNGIFARQEGVTGREVAALLFATASSKPEGMVRVRMLDLLMPQPVEVRNLENTAIPCSGGFLGSNSVRLLKPGDDIGPGLLEVHMPRSRLRRIFHGQLRMDSASRLIATMTEKEYVSGVINAELTQEHPDRLRIELGAAALRYLKKHPRHGDADVCDNTHCAWFIGRGPRADWSMPKIAREASRILNPINDSLWRDILIRANTHGPSFWTSHCGGGSMSPRSIWGNGSIETTPCSLHLQPTSPWKRDWDVAKLEKAIGERIISAQIHWPKSQWMLRLQTPSRSRDFNYDAAHRLVASISGWDALPSPADSVRLSDTKIHVQGHGSGHRVGLCLGVK